MLDRALQMRLARHRVSIGHWPFLRALWEADGLTQRELSREAGVMEPTTFAALKAMESLGYIVRRPVPEDRRKKQVFLTPRGRALERQLVPLAMEINAVAIRDVAPADVNATRRTLLAVLANLAADWKLASRATAGSGFPRRASSDAASVSQRPAPAVREAETERGTCHVQAAPDARLLALRPHPRRWPTVACDRRASISTTSGSRSRRRSSGCCGTASSTWRRCRCRPMR